MGDGPSVKYTAGDWVKSAVGNRGAGRDAEGASPAATPRREEMSTEKRRALAGRLAQERSALQTEARRRGAARWSPYAVSV